MEHCVNNIGCTVLLQVGASSKPFKVLENLALDEYTYK